MRGYNTRGDTGHCCTKAPYYASNERAGEGGLEVGDQVYYIHLGSAEVERRNSDALRHPIAALSEEVEHYQVLRNTKPSFDKSALDFI